RTPRADLCQSRLPPAAPCQQPGRGPEGRQLWFRSGLLGPHSRLRGVFVRSATRIHRRRRPLGSDRADRRPDPPASCHYRPVVTTVPGQSGIGGSTVIKLPEQIEDGYRRLSEMKDARLTRDVALLGARVALAWVFVYHGAATLFGAFGGPGVHRASIFY